MIVAVNAVAVVAFGSSRSGRGRDMLISAEPQANEDSEEEDRQDLGEAGRKTDWRPQYDDASRAKQDHDVAGHFDGQISPRASRHAAGGWRRMADADKVNKPKRCVNYVSAAKLLCQHHGPGVERCRNAAVLQPKNDTRKNCAGTKSNAGTLGGGLGASTSAVAARSRAIMAPGAS